MALYRYRHDGPCGRVHTHLSIGRGIVVRVDPATPRALPWGSTVELQPGDILTTTAPYVHPELTEIDPMPTARAPVAPPARRVPETPTRVRVPAQAGPVD